MMNSNILPEKKDYTPKKKHSKIFYTSVFCGAIFAGAFLYSSFNLTEVQSKKMTVSKQDIQSNLKNAISAHKYNEMENAILVSKLKSDEAEIVAKGEDKKQEQNQNSSTNSKPKPEQPKPEEKPKPEAPKLPNNYGKFDASIYGVAPSLDKVNHWKRINPDVIGYLSIPGTNINYPVVQNIYDVNYYTHKNIYGNNDKYGVIWTNPDTNSSGTADTLSDNTVLYGHNWKNVSSNPRVVSPNDIMFEQLAGYHYADMGRSYPYIYYTSLEEQMTFVIFATFYTEIDFDYIQTYGANDYIISEALSRSRNTFGVDVNANDKIITLSTCTRAYGKSDRQRFVVMARMLRPGETITPIDVTYNPHHKQPSNLW